MICIVKSTVQINTNFCTDIQTDPAMQVKCPLITSLDILATDHDKHGLSCFSLTKNKIEVIHIVRTNVPYLSTKELIVSIQTTICFFHHLLQVASIRYWALSRLEDYSSKRLMFFVSLHLIVRFKGSGNFNLIFFEILYYVFTRLKKYVLVLTDLRFRNG